MTIAPNIRRYYDQLVADAGRVEIRHNPAPNIWTTAWADSVDQVLALIAAASTTGNCYTSLNVPRVVTGPVGNDDIKRFSRILFDLDPERPTGTASTDAELAASEARCREVLRFLRGHGWPMPATAMSGNGSHLQYRTALPNTPEAREQLAAIYRGLKESFSDDMVVFDTSVKNPGRICTAYGTTKRKGTATPERPHRLSTIVIPTPWEQVRPHLVEALANRFAKVTRIDRQQSAVALLDGAGDYTSLNVVAWFTAHGLYVRHLHQHLHGVRCPWSGEHSTPSPADGGDTIIFDADGGWPGFHCKHAHCDGRTIREVIALLGDADAYCSRQFERRAAI